jgi:hypothetical protein
LHERLSTRLGQADDTRVRLRLTDALHRPHNSLSSR